MSILDLDSGTEGKKKMDKIMAMQIRVLSYNKDMIRTLLPF